MNTLPATTQLSTLSQEIGELTEKLAPPTSEMIAANLLSMRRVGMAYSKGIEPEMIETVYSYALRDVPAVGLQEATKKILKGEYNIEYGFIPKPPELAAMARAEAKEERDKRAGLIEKQRTLQDLSSYRSRKPDQGTKERIRDMLGRFRAETAAARVENALPQETMSEERAAYFAQIMQLNDAKGGPDASQMAFRRKIKAEIERASLGEVKE